MESGFRKGSTMKIILANEEYNVLNKIATQTKMDCWFHIGIDDDGNDHIFDLETSTWMPLRRGVAMLNDGIVPELLSLTNEEIFVYLDVLRDLDIEENPFEEYIQTMMNVYDGNANGICTESEDSDDI